MTRALKTRTPSRNPRKRALLALAAIMLSLVAIAGLASNKDAHLKTSAKEGGHNFPPTAWDYAQLVEPILGVPPKVDLGEAIEMPLYVEGVQVHGVFEDCDNPSRLGKGCISGSVVQSYEGRTAEGSPLPEVVWVAFGRNSTQLDMGIAGSVQMIGYHKVTGATAFFESSDAIEPWAYLDEETQRLKGVMPWIDDPVEFNRAFRTPGEIQCVGCHQNDPFIHNSFIDAARNPETGRPVVPVVRTRDLEFESDLPYYVIGGENWDMRTIYIERNGCVGCHRIGMATLNMYMRTGWNPHEEMPPANPGKFRDDFEELMDCWTNTPEKTEDCDWIVPPAGSAPGRIVGDDYPFKAEFNLPGLEKSKGDDGFNIKQELGDIEAAIEEIEHAEKSGSLTSEEAKEQRENLEHWIEILKQYQSGLDEIDAALAEGKLNEQHAYLKRVELESRLFGKGKD